MDNAYIHDLLTFQPPWKSELAKWKEKSTPIAKSEEPGPDIGERLVSNHLLAHSLCCSTLHNCSEGQAKKPPQQTMYANTFMNLLHCLTIS